MNISLGLIQLISIIVIALFEYRNASISIFLWATLFVIFGIPHFLSTLTQEFIYPEDVYAYASIFVIMFNSLYFISRYIFIGIFKRKCVINTIKSNVENQYFLFNEKKETKRLLITILFFIIVWFITLIQRHGSIMTISWGLLYKSSVNIYSLGLNWQTLISYFTKYVLYGIGGLFIIFFYQKKIVSSLIVAGIIIFYSIITRNRIMILPILIPMIIIFLVKNRKLNSRSIFIYCILGFFAIYLVYGLRLFRHYGGLDVFLSSFNFTEFNNILISRVLNNSGELGLRNIFLYFINNNNNFENFNKGHTYLRLLFILIPTKFSFGVKPPDFTISMYNAYSGNIYNTTYSVHPTLYGDCFANFYWFGFLLAIFWAFFTTFIDRLADRKSLVVKSGLAVIWGCIFVIIGRGSVYNGVILGVISSLFLLISYPVYHFFPLIRLKPNIKRIIVYPQEEDDK